MDVRDAVEVENHIQQIFAAAPSERAATIRQLFVETLDFDADFGQVSLVSALGAGNASLPGAAERIAQLDGVYVLYIALDIDGDNRVRVTEASTAARVIADQLGDDLVLVFTNTSATQLHFIHPNFEGSRPVLRRMVVEKDLPRRTAVQQVANIYWNHRQTGDIRAALKGAFDVERVTKRFFDEYKRVFEVAENGVAGFEDDDESKRLFVQTLFNRLMFVYFLQRKGWLTFEGDNDYLNALWKSYPAQSEDKNFYESRLKPLFFAGLNNPQSTNLQRDNPALHSLIGDVPFLNGGLFERNELDKRDGIEVPDEAIEGVLRELFDKFNFTVMESTPFDIEVAVDPEMLGKVFEELVTGRHDSGSYYTPRPVVSFMCREALKGYLDGRDTGLDAAAIARFIDAHDPSGITPAAASKVGQAIDEVTVVDPACGSGAYLLGMMQELVELQTALYNVRVDPRNLYELKLHIIERNLHGVDNDEFAVNIAMLRLWLSLAIDYDEGSPPPLPNLDFKIVCGDSLLGPDPSQLSLERGLIERSRIGEFKADYMRESNVSAKAAFKKRIGEAEDELRESIGGTTVPDGVVDWRIAFAEVLGERGGFDVAIANPPYVRFQKISNKYKRMLKPLFKKGTEGKSDLYCYFYVRSVELLKDGGMHVFVCSNSWLDVKYGGKLQSYLLDIVYIQAIYESAIERQFSTAEINTIVSIMCKTADEDKTTRFVHLRDKFDIAIMPDGQRRETLIKRSDLQASVKDGRQNTGDKWGAKYLRAPDIYHTILRKGMDKLVRLGDISDVSRGIITGANKFFFLDSESVAEWGVEDEFLTPVMTTPRESSSIIVNPDELPKRLFFCHQPKMALTGTRALAYIEWGEAQNFHRKSAPAARKIWYSIRHVVSRMATPIFVGSTARTVLTCEDIAFSDNFQVIRNTVLSHKATCVSMNSAVTQLLINVEGRANFGAGVLEIQTYELQDLLLVDPRLLTDLDAAVLATAKWDVTMPSPERRIIDEQVFDVLDLTTGEREGVYDGIREIAANRRRKARSA